ncbi:MAG: ABC transporter ATP-binding protein [Bifidobacteriaceae bacterium]|jgi:multidrug/hemolysin transport system ATP-binding protein|nr:ABC transporter ATP-binding protein [Bifidobacteriaceae bacterium]
MRADHENSLAVRVDGLTKRFGDLTAVDDLSFEVSAGDLFAFLGPNGSGKTTTIRCLTALDRPDAGTITVAGYRLGAYDDAIRRAIGVVFQDSLLDPKLTVRENLLCRAAAYGINSARFRHRLGELEGRIEIADFVDQRYGTLSGGQRRRADVARALIHSPRIIFLDEPTSGLDPTARDQVWKTINALRQDHGTTVFLTTHYLAETEDADDIVLLGKGRMIAHGTPQALRERFSTSILTITPAPGVPSAADAVRRVLAPWGGGVEVGGGLRVDVDSAATARGLLAELGENASDFEFRHGTMDDVFLSLTDAEPEPRGGERPNSEHTGPAPDPQAQRNAGEDTSPATPREETP